MKKWLTDLNTLSSNDSDDAFALSLLNMEDKVVEHRLQEIAAREVQSSVHRLKDKLSLKKDSPNLSLVENQLPFNDQSDVASAIVKSSNSQKNAEKTALNTLACWLKKFYLHPKQFFAYSTCAAVFLIVAVTATTFSDMDRSDSVDGFSAVLAGDVSKDSVNPINLDRGVDRDTEKQIDADEVFKAMLNLPNGHPVFDDNTMSIAVNECRQCHADVFAGLQQLL